MCFANITVQLLTYALLGVKTIMNHATMNCMFANLSVDIQKDDLVRLTFTLQDNMKFFVILKSNELEALIGVLDSIGECLYHRNSNDEN